ncbi:hypothetical protein [Polluticaenibacter yanchengensis]|uniref:Uncharacterized protein n=1 Tax=Polluticaenibacter yanchengensis TaxID=3014562 RepID=A0ABT4UIR3_9BACT|nr:hypothetical protein [Chitinophagaceae bacterium LY-5]
MENPIVTCVCHTLLENDAFTVNSLYEPDGSPFTKITGKCDECDQNYEVLTPGHFETKERALEWLNAFIEENE